MANCKHLSHIVLYSFLLLSSVFAEPVLPTSTPALPEFEPPTINVHSVSLIHPYANRICSEGASSSIFDPPCMRKDHRDLLTEYCRVLPLIRSIHTEIMDPNTYDAVGNNTEEIDATVKTLLLSTATRKHGLSRLKKNIVVPHKNKASSLRPLGPQSEVPRLGIMKLFNMYFLPVIGMDRTGGGPFVERANFCSDLHIAAIHHIVKSLDLLIDLLSTYTAELTRVNDHLRHIIGASASPSRSLSPSSSLSRKDYDALTGQLFTKFRSIRGNILDAHPLSSTELACFHYILSSYLTAPKASRHPNDGRDFGWYRIKDDQHDFISMQTLCGLNQVDDVAPTELVHSKLTTDSSQAALGSGGSKERWEWRQENWMEVAMDMHVNGSDDQGNGEGEAKGEERGVELGEDEVEDQLKVGDAGDEQERLG